MQTVSSCLSGPLLSLLFLLLLLCPQQSADAGRVLIYPFGHCLNSHLLNAERLGEILLRGGHQVDMLVSTAYRRYEHHYGDDHLGDAPAGNKVLFVQFQFQANSF